MLGEGLSLLLVVVLNGRLLFDRSASFVVVVRKGAVSFSFKVVSFPKSRVGAALVSEYAKNITPQDQLDKLEMIRLSNRDKPKGVGRPTKRERRSWDKAFEE